MGRRHSRRAMLPPAPAPAAIGSISIPEMLGALAMVVLVLGGIHLGFFTPTEAAAAGVAYALMGLLGPALVMIFPDIALPLPGYVK